MDLMIGLLGAVILQAYGYPDVWYDTSQLAIAGTASWVFAVLVISYYLLKWRKNSEKFYKALDKQQKAVKESK
jgi:hypothetical protein